MVVQFAMYYLDTWTCMHVHITTDPKKLTLLNIIGSGTVGTVHRACWRGIIVAAKLIPLQCQVTSKEVMDLYLYIG